MIKYLPWYHSNSHINHMYALFSIRTVKFYISLSDNGQHPAPPTISSASYSKASSNFSHNCFTPTSSSLGNQKILLFLINVFGLYVMSLYHKLYFVSTIYLLEQYFGIFFCTAIVRVAILL